MSLNEKSFKELNEMVEEVAYRFFIARKMDANKQRAEVLNEETPPYLVYLLRVERAYRSLDERACECVRLKGKGEPKLQMGLRLLIG